MKKLFKVRLQSGVILPEDYESKQEAKKARNAINTKNGHEVATITLGPDHRLYKK